MILDTSVIIDVTNRDERAIEYVSGLDGTSRPQRISTITLTELYEGVARAQRPSGERDALTEILESKLLAPVTLSIGRCAGEIRGELFDAGTPIEREDRLIGATALSYGEPVLTRNAGHFERIDGLNVRSY